MNSSPIVNTLFTGEDSPIVLDLGTTLFSDLIDIVVGFRIDDTLVKTMKKTETGNNEIIVHPDSTTKCIARLFSTETVDWTVDATAGVGRLILEIDVVTDDDLFPDGKHEKQVIYLCDFSPTLVL